MTKFRILRNIGTAGLRSEIKRLNERIASIGRRYGKDSEAYRNAIAPFQTEEFKKYSGESESGYFKLAIDLRKKDVREDPTMYNIVSTAQGSVRTISQLEDRARRSLESEEGRTKAPTRSEIVEEVERTAYYRTEMSQVHEFIYKNYTDAEAANKFPELYRGQNGKKPTYEELDQVIKRVNAEREEWARKAKNI